MVLRDISEPRTNNESFSNEVFSDSDPFEGQKSTVTTSQYYIDMTNLPRPVPFIGNLLGYGNNFKQEIQLKMLLASKELDRRLHQDEVDAFAYWLAKRQAITSWGAPIGFFGGAWRSYSTAETYKFPFWQPSSNHLKMNVFGPFRGSRAILCWHTLRFFAYGLTGEFIGRLLFGSYAMSTVAVGASSDPRLHEYMYSIKEKIRDFSKNDIRTERHTDSVEKKKTRTIRDEVDSSPTEMREEFYDEFSRGSEKKSDRAIHPDLKVEHWNLVNSNPLSNQNIDNNPLDDFDHVSSQEKQKINTGEISGNSYISAWERIRSGQNTPISRAPQRSPLDFSSKQKFEKDSSDNKSFSFPKPDGELTHAQDEAQKIIETTIDREQRGPDWS